MKNVGICITGLIRTWNSCYPNLIKNLIENNKELKFYLIGYINGIDNENEFKSKYNFDFLKIGIDEPLPNIEYQKNKYKYNLGTTLYINAYYQLYDLKKVAECVQQYETENEIKMDYIIRTRSDLDILKPCALPLPKDNTIYIPNGHDWLGYNDRFAFGKRDEMFTYLKRYDFWMNENNQIPNYTTHIESNLKIYLNYYNISVERLNDLNYSFKRNINGKEINAEGFYNGKVYMGVNNIINV